MLRLLVSAVCDVATGVLVAAGLSKLVDPRPWARAVVGLVPRLVRRTAAVRLAGRLAGAGEVTLAIMVVTGLGSPTSAFASMAVTYALFTVVAAVAAVRGVSCGCFGDRSLVAGRAHVVATVVASVAAASAAAVGSPLYSRLDGPLSESLAYLAMTGLGTVLVVALVTSAADLGVVVRASGERRGHEPGRRHTTGGGQRAQVAR